MDHKIKVWQLEFSCYLVWKLRYIDFPCRTSSIWLPSIYDFPHCFSLHIIRIIGLLGVPWPQKHEITVGILVYLVCKLRYHISTYLMPPGTSNVPPLFHVYPGVVWDHENKNVNFNDWGMKSSILLILEQVKSCWKKQRGRLVLNPVGLSRFVI